MTSATDGWWLLRWWLPRGIICDKKTSYVIGLGLGLIKCSWQNSKMSRMIMTFFADQNVMDSSMMWGTWHFFLMDGLRDIFLSSVTFWEPCTTRFLVVTSMKNKNAMMQSLRRNWNINTSASRTVVLIWMRRRGDLSVQCVRNPDTRHKLKLIKRLYDTFPSFRIISATVFCRKEETRTHALAQCCYKRRHANKPWKQSTVRSDFIKRLNKFVETHF
jgi:hypothetical protein